MTADPPGPFGTSRPRLLGLTLFLSLLVVYHVNGKPQYEVDCVTPPYTAWSLAQRGSLDLRPHAIHLETYLGTEVRALPDGSWIAYRPPGAALVTFPFVAPLAWLCQDAPPVLTIMHLGKLAAACCVALSAVVFFFLVLRHAPLAAWPATILYALGTSLWSVASQAVWPHGPAVLTVCAGLSLLLPGQGRPPGPVRSALAGFLLGFAVLIRPTTVFFLPATGLALLASRRWRETLAFGLTASLPVLVLLLYHVHFFGDPVHGGYGKPGWEPTMPLWQRALGLLGAPSRGLLVYSPALILVGPGLWLGWRAGSWTRLLLGCWLGATAATLWCFARWICWWAGWCYGPRFCSETMPLVCLVSALGLTALAVRWQRLLAGGLIALSVFIHAVGVFGHSAHADWHLRHTREQEGQAMFDLEDNQIQAHTRAVWLKLRRSPLSR